MLKISCSLHYTGGDNQVHLITMQSLKLLLRVDTNFIWWSFITCHFSSNIFNIVLIHKWLGDGWVDFQVKYLHRQYVWTRRPFDLWSSVPTNLLLQVSLMGSCTKLVSNTDKTAKNNNKSNRVEWLLHRRIPTVTDHLFTHLSILKLW